MGRKKSRNASTSGSSSHNRSQTDLRRSNFVHKFSRTNFVRKVSRTKTKVSRSVRRRREKLEEETASIIQQLDIFMEALESSECSEDEDKTISDNWGKARGSANFLKQRDVPVDSLDKVKAMVALNDHYGFEGRLVMDAMVLSKEDLEAMMDLAGKFGLKVKDDEDEE
ncbi:hypothetical protein ACP275_10G017900 [Erythranthe tilingii]